MAWDIYRIQTQTEINPLDPRRDGELGGGRGREMMNEGKSTIYDRGKLID